MGKPMIEVGSVTYAMKGRGLLARYGIWSRVEKIARTAQGRGCSFGIYVPNRTNEAENILKREGIPVFGRSEREVQL